MAQTERVLQILKTCDITNPSASLDNLITDIESEDIVIVDGDTWDEMNKRNTFLCYLEGCGVDNWAGYELAQDMMSEEEND